MKTLLWTLTCLMILASNLSAQDKIKALIIDGQNNHRIWPKTTMMMKKYLEESGRFEVDIARTKYTWQGDDLLEQFPLQDGVERSKEKASKSDPDFAPKFDRYQVVISNFGFGAAPWPKATEEAFEKFVAGGGGFVVIHAADNSFGEWEQYNRMIGVGGWGGRTEKHGPYHYLDDSGKLVRDSTPGNGGSHGSQHEYEVIIRQADHPITRGLPRSFLHAKDELYDRLRGPGENMQILATAFASKDQGGTGRHEPMLMTIEFDRGRIFHTPMGDADYSMECVGFITLFLRGTEWAATGNVTLTDVPSDFPKPDQASSRPFR